MVWETQMMVRDRYHHCPTVDLDYHQWELPHSNLDRALERLHHDWYEHQPGHCCYRLHLLVEIEHSQMELVVYQCLCRLWTRCWPNLERRVALLYQYPPWRKAETQMAVHWERFDLEGKLELEVAVCYYSSLTLTDLECYQADLEHYKLLEMVVAVVVAALMGTGYHK